MQSVENISNHANYASGPKPSPTVLREKKYSPSQGLARPSFKLRDRECLNPSLNIETEIKTMNLEDSVLRLRPRL